MFKVNQKLNLVLFCILALSLVFGLTLTIVTSVYVPLDINNEPDLVSCEVSQNGNEYSISNTGNVDVYVRVAVIANYVQEGTDAVYFKTPEYTVTLTQTEDIKWQKYGDYYYCLATVKPQNEESEEDESVSFASISITGTAPTGYLERIEVIAEAIDEDIIAESWGIKITSNGIGLVA